MNMQVLNLKALFFLLTQTYPSSAYIESIHYLRYHVLESASLRPFKDRQRCQSYYEALSKRENIFFSTSDEVLFYYTTTKNSVKNVKMKFMEFMAFPKVLTYFLSSQVSGDDFYKMAVIRVIVWIASVITMATAAYGKMNNIIHALTLAGILVELMSLRQWKMFFNSFHSVLNLNLFGSLNQF